MRLLLTMLAAACWFAIGVVSTIESETQAKGSFLWQVEPDQGKNSYFFGTIHVPFDKVVDSIPDNVLEAFKEANHFYFELDTSSPMLAEQMWKCQMLPGEQKISDVLPAELYSRLQSHMDEVCQSMPEWVAKDPALTTQILDTNPLTELLSPEQKEQLISKLIFDSIASNWERKHPYWLIDIISSLQEKHISSGVLQNIPLDFYLSQVAIVSGKFVRGIEQPQEHCKFLQEMDMSLVIQKLSQTLKRAEDVLKGQAEPDESMEEERDELIKQYRSGKLDAESLFNPDDDYKVKFLQEVLYKRNEVMASRVIDLIKNNPDFSYFFAFGAGHFVDSSQGNSILDIVREAGFQIRHILPGENLHQNLREEL